MFGWLKRKPEWEYGTAGPEDRPARRHTKNGNVQFVLWKAGQQGHSTDYWHNFDNSWWPTFKRSNNCFNLTPSVQVKQMLEPNEEGGET